MYLLQRYLEIKHNSKSESETRFLRLMNCVNELYAVSLMIKSNFANIIDNDPQTDGSIFKEIVFS